MNKYRKLRTLDAWGAIEESHFEKINKGYEMFESFRAGRNLKRVIPSKEFIPWLFRARFYSKKWYETYDILPPFKDHERCFLDGKERIITFQPYLLSVASEGSTHTHQQDFECEPLCLPDEFWAIYCDCVNSRKQFKPLPDLPVVKETVGAILDKAKKVSDEFASKHGLHASVSFNGWYNPEQVILIEYARSTDGSSR